MVDGKADSRDPAVAQDGNQRVELDAVLCQWPHAQMCPVGLELDPGISLKADERLIRASGTQPLEVAQEGAVAASVPIVPAELVMEDGGAKRGTDGEAPL
jgi:hypothetical protein